MYIIEVIPISRGIPHDTLSYFTAKEMRAGSIVDVPLRSKIVKGIIISIRNAEDMKGEIKNAGFALKKIDKVKSSKFLSQSFMKMVDEVAQYYSTSPGAVLDILVPKYILNNIEKLKINKSIEEKTYSKNILKEKYAVQGDNEERYGTWRGLIRQEFARKKSLIFVTPTIEEAQHSFNLLEKGIEGYAFILHGSLTTKKIVDTWNKIAKEEHPLVIVMTGGFLSVPRDDIETLILEGESNKSYKIQRRPFLDVRTVCEIFAEKSNMKIFLGDNPLRTETLWRESEGLIVQASPFKFRSLSTANGILVDMKKYKNVNSSFKILSDEVEEMILKTKANSEHMMILATRRGMAPTTICGDCQNVVLCNSCSAPVVLHNTNGKTFFMCHRCGERRSTEEYCKTCGSWKLGTVGIGIDLVIEKIKSKFPDTNIYKIDSDSIKDEKVAHEVVAMFRAKPGSILIGTEMMLQYIYEKVENSAVVSLDSLFALPDFRIQEKILYMLIRLREITMNNIIVQTRKSDEKVFEYGLKGNMNDFYKTSIEERKKFNYPPFSTLIKITLEGNKDEIVKEMENVQNILDPFEVEVFPAFTHTIRGNYVLHGLIRLPFEKWPNEDLSMKLRSLSPAVVIKVDPESLL